MSGEERIKVQLEKNLAALREVKGEAALTKGPEAADRLADDYYNASEDRFKGAKE